MIIFRIALATSFFLCAATLGSAAPFSYMIFHTKYWSVTSKGSGVARSCDLMYSDPANPNVFEITYELNMGWTISMSLPVARVPMDSGTFLVSIDNHAPVATLMKSSISGGLFTLQSQPLSRDTLVAMGSEMNEKYSALMLTTESGEIVDAAPLGGTPGDEFDKAFSAFRACSRFPR